MKTISTTPSPLEPSTASKARSSRATKPGKTNKFQSRKASTNSLQRAFLNELAEIQNAEEQLLKALPALARAAQESRLKQAIQNHTQATREQVKRNQRIFKLLGKPVKTRPCIGMRAILSEAKKALQGRPSPNRDALLAAAAQKAEHYEIASYGTLTSWASTLGCDEVVRILDSTLQEEEETDHSLSKISEARLHSEDRSSNQDERNSPPRENESGSSSYGNGRSGNSRGSDSRGSTNASPQSGRRFETRGTSQRNDAWETGGGESYGSSSFSGEGEESGRYRPSERRSFRAEHDENRRESPGGSGYQDYEYEDQSPLKTSGSWEEPYGRSSSSGERESDYGSDDRGRGRESDWSSSSGSQERRSGGSENRSRSSSSGGQRDDSKGAYSSSSSRGNDRSRGSSQNRQGSSLEYSQESRSRSGRSSYAGRGE